MKRFFVAAAALLAPITAFAFPVDIAGTLDVRAGVAIPVDLEATLAANHTLTGVINTMGIQQAIQGTWRRTPRGAIVLSVPGLITVGGTPANGCITGRNTQPTPALLIPLGATPTMNVAWDLCAVP